MKNKLNVIKLGLVLLLMATVLVNCKGEDEHKHEDQHEHDGSHDHDHSEE